MGKLNQERNHRRHEFLLTFFSPEPVYQVKEVNGFVLVKQFNAGMKEWQVAIYTPENFNKAKEYYQSKSNPQKSIIEERILL